MRLPIKIRRLVNKAGVGVWDIVFRVRRTNPDTMMQVLRCQRMCFRDVMEGNPDTEQGCANRGFPCDYVGLPCVVPDDVHGDNS